jgi:hypothetical protein
MDSGARYYVILSQDLGYGQNESLTSALEETSKLLNAYVRTILACDSFKSHRLFNPANRWRSWPLAPYPAGISKAKPLAS